MPRVIIYFKGRVGVESLVSFCLCLKLAFDEERDMVVREEEGERVNKGEE